MGTLRTAEELKGFRACAESFPHFLASYVHIRDEGGRRFHPWPFQIRLARVWGRSRLVIILKGRQLGISWMAAAYALWMAMFHPGALVLLVSQTLTDAQELFAKVRFIFERLPEWLKPEVGRNNTLVLEFPKLSSAVEALPSTERAGRGRTARLVVADEYAFHQWSESNFAALSPTIDAGGQFIALSTANGIGGFFAELWTRAGEVKSGWHRVFLPYSLRPGRDPQWYEQKQASYPRPWMIHQEYPREAEEAFVQTGRPVFGKEHVDRQKALCQAPLPMDSWPGVFDGWAADELRMFAKPKPGARYIAGADVAEGLEHGDYSDLAVFDASGDRPVEVLSLHGHWAPDVFGDRIADIARLYPGLYGIERNNHGLATIIQARKRGMAGLFAERAVLNRQGQAIQPGLPGWSTSSITKPLMIDDLEQAIRLTHLELRDALAIPELVFYQTKKDGSTGAPSGQWDDRVISRAIAMQMRKHLPAKVDPVPDYHGPSTFAPTSW